jgi:hypothetical protein
VFDWIAWLVDPEHLPGTMTAAGVYLGAPLLVSWLIEVSKTDRVRKHLRKPGRLRVWACQVAGTTVVGTFVGYAPGIWESINALNHAFTAGLFSVFTLHAIKWALERWAPRLHEAIFFAERRKRAALRGKPFDPNDTTITDTEVGK